MAGRMGKKSLTKMENGKVKKGKIYDTHCTFRTCWGHLDEARYYSFIRGIDLCQFMREALFIWLRKHREKKHMTVEEEAKLNAIGGWPTREEQDRRVAEFKGKTGGRPFNQWLWNKKPNFVEEPTERIGDLNADEKTTQKRKE